MKTCSNVVETILFMARRVNEARELSSHWAHVAVLPGAGKHCQQASDIAVIEQSHEESDFVEFLTKRGVR